MTISNNRQDRDRAAYRENPNDLGTDRRVADLDAHQKLDDIYNAIGGTAPTTATVFNVAVGTPDSEVSQALPANTKAFKLRCRGSARLQLSHQAGATGSNYFTVAPGNVYTDENFYTSLTIYFRTSKMETVEIIAYT